MIGLPASGKSTKAKEITTQGSPVVRINKDLLRTMLHFDKFNFKNEENTRNAARKLADWFLSQDVGVIIDDTNLNPSTLQSYKDLAKIHGAEIEYHDFTDVPLPVLFSRDEDREKKVGNSVIWGMAMQYRLYTPQKGYVIVDIDGTVADIAHRRHFVDQKPKDWKSFFDAMIEDTPRPDVVEKVKKFKEEGYDIVFVSGRPDNYRILTELWLKKFVITGTYPLFMRRADDGRPDTEVKKDILNQYFKDKSLIHTVIDDRPSVIRMWRAEGLLVDDVGDGKEF